MCGFFHSIGSAIISIVVITIIGVIGGCVIATHNCSVNATSTAIFSCSATSAATAATAACLGGGCSTYAHLTFNTINAFGRGVDDGW